jgi:hypothetical protein
MLRSVRWLLFDRRANAVFPRPMHNSFGAHAVEWRNLGVRHVDGEMSELLQRGLLGDASIGSSTGHAAVVLPVPPRPRNLHHIPALGALASLCDTVHPWLANILLSARRCAVYMGFARWSEENPTPPAANIWAPVCGSSALVGAVLGFAGLRWLLSVRKLAVLADNRWSVLSLCCSPARDGAVACA